MTENNLNWQTWLAHGDQYLKSGTKRENSRIKFGSEIRYNVLSMALEAYIMSIVDFHHTLPDNHTYTDLIDSLESVMQIDQELKQRILKYENIQSICSIDKYYRESPTEEQLDDLFGAIVQLSELAHGVCV
jgi:hypothetical protein